MERPLYEILEHTADVGLKAYGRTLAELFANAGRGLVSLAVEPGEAPRSESLSLAARGEDREELLVHWLSEILYALDVDGWVFADFEIRKLGGQEIEAQGWGARRPPVETHWRVAVKAVTYHQVAVRETPEGWEAVVYFDI